MSWIWLAAPGKLCQKLFDYIEIINDATTINYNSVDSIMLVENGFDVVSVDASDKMLKYALKERWNRRQEKGFDSWSKCSLKKMETIS